MTIDRQRTNFDGNERVDIPDFRGMLDNAFDDYRNLIRLLVDDSARRVVKRYTQGTHVGLAFKIALDVERGFYDSTQEWVVKTPDAMGSVASLTLSPNSTNYVEVRVNAFTDNPQPRAFWDVDIGLTGEEFFDTINVRKRIEEGFQSNTSGFTPGAVPLFLVTTGSSTITNVLATPQDLLWEPRSLALPDPDDRSTGFYDQIRDLRGFIDTLGAIVSEAKGAGQLFHSAPWSTLKLLREYQGLFITSTPTVTFEGAFGTDKLNISTDLKFDIAGRAGGQYSLAAATFTIADGQALYVEIPEASPPQTLTPTVVAIGAVPINPTASGSSPRIYVLFVRRGTVVYGAMDLSPLDSGESDTIGRDLPIALRLRIGLLTETTYEAYTSTTVIDTADTYPAAFSKLDAEFAAINSNNPKEAWWSASGVQTTFDMASGATFSDGTFSWLTDNTKSDIVVTVDGREQTRDYGGGTGQSYRKLTSTTIQFNVAPDAGSRVKVRKGGTAYGGSGGGGGGGGISWSTPVDSDISGPDIAFDIGSASNRFAEGHFFEGFFDTVYAKRVVMTETALGNLSQMKSKINGESFLVPAGTQIGLYSDGKVYKFDANDPQRWQNVGMTLQDLAPAGSGLCLLHGMNVPGVLTGLGFAPGEEVFVDNTGAYTTGTGLDGTSVVARVGFADCTDGGASAVVTDLISSYQKIATP